MRNTPDCINRLQAAGISYDDAIALRRISMTLQRWHELECGDGNNYGSWCITRGFNTKPFEHNDDGRPYLEHHHYRHGQGQDSVTYTLMPDRENGAKKRLAKIMAQYPGFAAYIQTDPRGCALYILRPQDLPYEFNHAHIDQFYTRGIAVYK